MSYPPQLPGPYGPQGQPAPGGPPPGGYGQRPPGQYGTPDVGFGRYPPPTGGYGPPPGGYGPPPGGPGSFGYGPGGPPPRRSRKGLWFGLGGGAVVVVAALLITGLAAPGWMLGGGNSPHDVAQAVAEAFNTKDFQPLREVACGGTDNDDIDDMQQKLRKSDITVDVTLTGDPKVDGDTATQRANVAIHGGPKDGQRAVFVMTMAKRDGQWCARGLQAESGRLSGSGAGAGSDSSSDSDPGYGSGSGPGSGSGASLSGTVQSVAQGFLDKVNAGDVTGATSMLCADAPARDTLRRIVDKGLRLKIKPGQDLSGSSFQIVNIEPASGHGGGFVSVFEADGGDGLCVHTFMAYAF